MTANDLEARLRATLADRAAQAPPGAALAERILAEVDSPARVLRPRHGWRTWTMPLLAAAAVAAVVATVVGIQNDRHTASPLPPAVSHSVAPSPAPTNSPKPGPTTPTATPTARLVAPAPGALTTHVSNPGAIEVNGFMALSSTFVSDDEGWVLGSSTCLDPTGPTNADGTCPAMLHTTDSGKTWSTVPNPPGNTPGLACADPCISAIRYANSTTGYAYSATTLEMTTDGGQTWSRSPGGALALETLDHNVIRVEQVPGCKAALCRDRVETAPIGSADWTVVETLPALVDEAPYGDSHVQLVRAAGQAALLTWTRKSVQGAPANSTAALYTSADDGHTWTAPTDPCTAPGLARAGHPLGAVAVDLSLDGSVHVLCSDGADTATREFMLTSSDHGATFTASPDFPFSVGTDAIGGPSTKTVVVPSDSGLERTTDGGQTWQRVIRVEPPNGGDPGFEDDQVGRWLSASGRTIWTTRDGGQTWTAFDFS